MCYADSIAWPRPTALMLTFVLTGCGGDALVLYPVAGKVTAAGEPITVGAVSFRPDAAKGNKSLHHPTGAIDPAGNYVLFTIDKKGAPPGWYKVLVFADGHDLVKWEKGRPLTPQWLVDARYVSEETTDLSVEVVETPAAGAYDLRCAKGRAK